MGMRAGLRGLLLGFPPGASGAGGAAPVFSDTFTAADSTSLDVHTPDVGGVGAWAEEAGNWSITSNQARTTAVNFARATIHVGAAPGRVEVVVLVDTNAGVIFRGIDSTNYWLVEMARTASLIRLYECTGGAFALEASATVTVNQTAVYTIAVIDDGANIEVQIDGVPVLTYTSTSKAAGARIGIYSYNSNASRFETLKAYEGSYEVDRAVSLPQNLMSQAAVLLEGFEDATDWTVNAGTVADNTTQVQQGNASCKMTSPDGTAAEIQRDASFDLSSYVAFRRMAYAHDANGASTTQVWYQGANSFTKAQTTIPSGQWSAYNTIRADYAASPTPPNWANAFTRLALQGTPTSGVFESSHDWLTGLPALPGAAVLIAFDDARPSVYSEAFAYMNARGVRGTVYVPSSLADTDGFCTWDQLEEMYAAGWDLGNHTSDHTNLTTLTQAEAETRLADCKTALDGRGFTRASAHVAYPNGGVNATVLAAMTAQNMLTGREDSEGAMFLPWGEYHLLPTRMVANTTTLAVAQGWVTTAITRGEVVIITFHSLVASPSAATEWYIDRFRSLIDTVVSKSKLGTAYPITISELHALRTAGASVRVP